MHNDINKSGTGNSRFPDEVIREYPHDAGVNEARSILIDLRCIEVMNPHEEKIYRT